MLPRVALGSSVAALVLQPIALVIAARQSDTDAAAGGILLCIAGSIFFALLALALGLVALVRASRKGSRVQKSALVAVILAVPAVPIALVVWFVSVMIASNGKWMYMS